MSKSKARFVSDDVLVTYREAAERLSVSYSTVRREVRDGKLLSVRVRGAVRIPLSEIQRSLNSQLGGAA